jgi:hypothetical protein
MLIKGEKAPTGVRDNRRSPEQSFRVNGRVRVLEAIGRNVPDRVLNIFLNLAPMFVNA